MLKATIDGEEVTSRQDCTYTTSLGEGYTVYNLECTDPDGKILNNTLNIYDSSSCDHDGDRTYSAHWGLLSEGSHMASVQIYAICKKCYHPIDSSTPVATPTPTGAPTSDGTDYLYTCTYTAGDGTVYTFTKLESELGGSSQTVVDPDECEHSTHMLEGINYVYTSGDTSYFAAKYVCARCGEDEQVVRVTPTSRSYDEDSEAYSFTFSIPMQLGQSETAVTRTVTVNADDFSYDCTHPDSYVVEQTQTATCSTKAKYRKYCYDCENYYEEEADGYDSDNHENPYIDSVEDGTKNLNNDIENFIVTLKCSSCGETIYTETVTCPDPVSMTEPDYNGRVTYTYNISVQYGGETYTQQITREESRYKFPQPGETNGQDGGDGDDPEECEHDDATINDITATWDWISKTDHQAKITLTLTCPTCESEIVLIDGATVTGALNDGFYKFNYTYEYNGVSKTFSNTDIYIDDVCDHSLSSESYGDWSLNSDETTATLIIRLKCSKCNNYIEYKTIPSVVGTEVSNNDLEFVHVETINGEEKTFRIRKSVLNYG